jgi:hypothetical protein
MIAVSILQVREQTDVTSTTQYLCLPTSQSSSSADPLLQAMPAHFGQP